MATELELDRTGHETTQGVATDVATAPRAVVRTEDMSPDGYLQLILRPDGDIIVGIYESAREGGGCAAVEFCFDSHSPATYTALRALLDAMEIDSSHDAPATEGGRVRFVFRG